MDRAVFPILTQRTNRIMASVLDEWPAEAINMSTRYPWEDWTNGQVWKILRGEDFNSTMDAMTHTLYRAAKRTGLRVRVHMDRQLEYFIFQFYMNEDL